MVYRLHSQVWMGGYRGGIPPPQEPKCSQYLLQQVGGEYTSSSSFNLTHWLPLSSYLSCWSSQTYHVIPKVYSPWNHRGEYSSSWYLDYTQVYLCLPLLSCTCGPPCTHQYSFLKRVGVNTLHSPSFDSAQGLPLLSCLIVHPEDLQCPRQTFFAPANLRGEYRSSLSLHFQLNQGVLKVIPFTPPLFLIAVLICLTRQILFLWKKRVKFPSWLPTRYSSKLPWLIQFLTL